MEDGSTGAYSHLFVAGAIEKSLTPGVFDMLVKLCFRNSVLNIGILVITVDTARVAHLLVGELEEVTINNLITAVFENLEEGGLIIRVSIGVELSECNKVLTVHSMIVLVLESEGADIEASLGRLHASAHSWVVFIQWGQVDSSVSVLPEASPHAHHITA